MKQVVICPICHGNGKVRKIDDIMIADAAPSIKEERRETCHGCGGKGWIEIGKDDYPNYPYIPYYPTPYYPTWLPNTTIIYGSSNF